MNENTSFHSVHIRHSTSTRHSHASANKCKHHKINQKTDDIKKTSINNQAKTSQIAELKNRATKDKPQQKKESKEIDQIASKIIQGTNKHRSNNQRQPLIEDERLSKIAQSHSESMAAKKEMSHNGFKERYITIQKKIPSITSVGENVAMNQGAKSPAEKVIEQWKTSPGHNENMLNHKFKYIGVGVAQEENGSYYFTQIFAQ